MYDYEHLNSYTRWATGYDGALNMVSNFYCDILPAQSRPMEYISEFIKKAVSPKLQERIDNICTSIDNWKSNAQRDGVYHNSCHHAKVVMNAIMLGHFMGISQDEMDYLVLTACVHDWRHHPVSKDEKEGYLERLSVTWAMNDGLITPMEYPLIEVLNRATIFPSFRSKFRVLKAKYDAATVPSPIEDCGWTVQRAKNDFDVAILNDEPVAVDNTVTCRPVKGSDTFYMVVMAILSDADLLGSAGISLRLNQIETSSIENEIGMKLDNKMRLGFMKTVGPFLTCAENTNFGKVRREIMQFYEDSAE